MKSLHLIALLLLIPHASHAESLCKLDDTVKSCWKRYFAVDDEELNRVTVEEERGESVALKEKPTGADTGGQSLDSNTKNFLPLLAASGFLGDIGEADNEGNVTLDLNFLISGLAKDKNAQLQAIVNTTPKISDGLKMALPADSQDEEKKEFEEALKKLEDGLDNLDDFTLSFTYNWTGMNAGRGFKQYENRFAALAAWARKEHKDDAKRIAEKPVWDSWGKLLVELQDLSNNPNLGEVKFKDLGSKGADLMALTERLAEQEATGLNSYRQRLDDMGLKYFADLVNNQPQFHLAAKRRFRDSLVGGDETSLKATYEWSAVNLKSSMKSACHTALDVDRPGTIDEKTLEDCASQYEDFVTENKDSMKTGNRFSGSLEYVDIDEDKIDLGALGLGDLGLTEHTLKASNKLVISFGWSRLLGSAANGETPMRFDLVGKYENVTDDPMRQDRGVVTLTLTRQFGDLAIPFGIVYANHSEFLTDVDEVVSAHIGIKFNAFSPKEGR